MLCTAEDVERVQAERELNRGHSHSAERSSGGIDRCATNWSISSKLARAQTIF